MSYSRAFGMRSFENIVRNGRFRTPAGSTLLIGEPVLMDPAAPGFMKQATAAVAPQGGGVVIFEHIQLQGVDAVLTTTSDLPSVPGGRYAQIVHGPGAKVWFRNSPAKTLYDGRTQAAVTLLAATLDLAALLPGDGLVPDGAGKFKKAAGGDDAWLTVEQVNPTAGVVEARFNF